jgi:hypothetical protein
MLKIIAGYITGERSFGFGLNEYKKKILWATSQMKLFLSVHFTASSFEFSPPLVTMSMCAIRQFLSLSALVNICVIASPLGHHLNSFVCLKPAVQTLNLVSPLSRVKQMSHIYQIP